MRIILHSWLLLVSLSPTLAVNDPDLPLCPTNLQFFPQKLPMHCRMPRNADPEAFPDLPQYPTLPPLPESYFQSPSPDKQPPPIPINIPPFPGIMGAMPMPGQMGGPMGGPMPGMPGAMPMPMPMVGGPPHKMPVIVMPFYSQDHSFKKPQPHKPRKHREKKRKPHKKKKKYYDSDTESSSCEESSESDDKSSSSDHGFWKGRRKARRKMTRRSNQQHRMTRTELKNKRKDLLTPILQYVTKDGYVIFEKKISKSEAKDWLRPQTQMTKLMENKQEEKNGEKPEEKRQEDFLFNSNSAEDFLKLDEEDKRLKAMEMKEEAEVKVTTRQGKRQHKPLKFNALINKSR